MCVCVLSWLRVSVFLCACFIHSTICSEFDRYAPRLHKYKREPTALVSTEFSFHVTSSSHEICVMLKVRHNIKCDGQSGPVE